MYHLCEVAYSLELPTQSYIIEFAHAFKRNASVVQSMDIPLLVRQDFRVILHCLLVEVQLGVGIGAIVIGLDDTDRPDLQFVGVVFDCLFEAA